MRPLEDSSIIKVKLPIWQTMEIFSRRMEIKTSIRSSGTQLHLLKWIAIVTVHDEQTSSTFGLTSVWPDLTIYWTLGNFLKPLAIIKLSQSPPFLGNFCKDVKIIHFSSETIFGATFIWSHWLTCVFISFHQSTRWANSSVWPAMVARFQEHLVNCHVRGTYY